MSSRAMTRLHSPSVLWVISRAISPATSAFAFLVILAVFMLVGGCPRAFSQSAPPPGLNGAQLIQYLDQTINWYHQLAVQQQIAVEPEEQLTVANNREVADKVVRLAFDFARAQAATLTKPESTQGATNANAGSLQYQSLRKLEANLEQVYQSTQAEADADQRKLASARGAERQRIESEISELQGELSLAKARRDAVASMVEFMNNSATRGAGATGLKAQIEALAASVPAAASKPEAAGEARSQSPSPAEAANETKPSGIWELAGNLIGLSSKMDTVNSLIQRTNALSTATKQLRAPFITQLKTMVNNGDQLAAQADTANGAALEQEKRQLDSLAAQFKNVSTTMISLSKEIVLLNLYANNLAGWRDNIKAAYKAEVKSLAVRLGILAVILGVLVGLGEVWRRAVLRYVHEPRRRHQFLLIRKIALWFVVGVIIAITLAGKLGSVATFAGLLTAGVALALQNVIVSIVGYFFLIGKYGIRVGDRVQVSGTSGEVIDVGLVRFHLMEMGSGGTPTGRVVALSNSIVFQPTAGLFKQIPGAKFAWHEVCFSVPREANFSLVKKTLLEVVENVLRDYQSEIESQYRELEKTGILLMEKGLRPRFELRFLPTGPEVTIRYPVVLQRASDIDAKISHELVMALERETELKVKESPEIQLKTDVPAGGAS